MYNKHGCDHFQRSEYQMDKQCIHMADSPALTNTIPHWQNCWQLATAEMWSLTKPLLCGIQEGVTVNTVFLLKIRPF